MDRVKKPNNLGESVGIASFAGMKLPAASGSLTRSRLSYAATTLIGIVRRPTRLGWAILAMTATIIYLGVCAVMRAQ